MNDIQRKFIEMLLLDAEISFDQEPYLTVPRRIYGMSQIQNLLKASRAYWGI